MTALTETSQYHRPIKIRLSPLRPQCWELTVVIAILGCPVASEEKPRQAQITNISRPRDLMLHVPRPRVDHDGRVIRIEDDELDRRTLEAALTTMAEFIDRQRQSITIITVRGAVNTLLCRTGSTPTTSTSARRTSTMISESC